MIENILKAVHNNLEHWNTPDNLALCLGCIDLTTLNTTDTAERIVSFTGKVNRFGEHFPQYPYPAAICVYPKWGMLVKEQLRAEGVKVAVVAGGFPHSQTFLDVKVAECAKAVELGADEVDVVLPLNLFLAGDMKGAAEEVAAMKNAVGDKCLKVILETGALQDVSDVMEASMLAMEAGADFIKTSTGKLEQGATPVAAIAMCRSIAEYYKKSGRRVGFKPAGGISNVKDALCYLAVVETILGKEWCNSSLFRIGASRLANNLLGALEQKTVGYY
ncbi:MAG: deoxyribose-phosphate aldolase [Bacteroidales bacterium]|nr:deoxyribose-phosphate aldolase [Bacteroidales bacterium]